MLSGDCLYDQASQQVPERPPHVRSKSANDIGSIDFDHSSLRLIKCAESTKMPASNDSSSVSEHSTASTPPSEDHAERSEDATQERNDFQVCEEAKVSPAPSRSPYLALDPEYMKWLCWSNDPADLYLSVYFNSEEPNLSRDFNVDGLRPVVKEHDSDTFILQDARNRFYFWDVWDGRLLRVKDIYIDGLESNEKIVEHLIIYQPYVERDTDVIYEDREED